MQDNDNLEMMTQVEGAIVDSLREVFLVSWHISIGPLPCVQDSAASMSLPTFKELSFVQLFSPGGAISLAKPGSRDGILPQHNGGDPHYDVDVAAEMRRTHAILIPRTVAESQVDVVARHLSMNQPLRAL